MIHENDDDVNFSGSKEKERKKERSLLPRRRRRFENGDFVASSKIKLGKFKTHQLESCTLSFLSLSSLSSLFLSVDLFLVESWSSLLQGDEQLDWPNSETNIEFGGRGGGQVVSVLAFYSNDPSSNPADASSFFCKNCI